jgi:hypothetical protein
MKKLTLGALLLGLAIMMPVQASARVNIDINIGLPPLVVFAGPPELVVIPGTYVYFAPDLDVNIFFYDGWWWRPWQGHWYRSRHYGSGWAYYNRTPYFYNRLPTGWRYEYKNRSWRGHEWNYYRVPHDELQKNWRTWQRDRYWEKQHNWGVSRNWNPKKEKSSKRSSKGSSNTGRKNR